MPSKYEYISELYKDTAKVIVKNSSEWKKYLTTASRIYKYGFDDQLLIYAQNPDATACASMEVWNKRMNCWVKRGSKGIALIDRNRKKLNYVFDVSNVQKMRDIGRDPNLWELKEEQKSSILEHLERIYGATDKTTSFEQRILEIAQIIGHEYYKQILPELNLVKADSFLEELDEQNMGLRLRDTLTSSIAYSILVRCGVDMTGLDDDIYFDYIHEFNTVEVLSILGYATSELVESVLIEIGKAVREYNREAEQQSVKKINESQFIKAEAGDESVAVDSKDGTRIEDSRGDSDRNNYSQLSLFGNEKPIVAIETTEDYSEPDIGFYTFHYPDGREGIRYRFVTLNEDGLLTPYPERNKFFINKYLIDEYIEAHKEDIMLTDYDNLVHQSMKKKTELYQDKTLHKSEEEVVLEAPTIKCEWSEHPTFVGGKTYSVSEFDNLMKQLDDEWVQKREEGIKKYGSEEAFYNANYNDEPLLAYAGYAKVKFTVNLPDGTSITERQDIGDGDGGVIDFFRKIQNQEVADILADAVGESYEPIYYVQKENLDDTENAVYELRVTNEIMDYNMVYTGYTIYKGTHDKCIDYLDKLHSKEITEEQIRKENATSEQKEKNIQSDNIVPQSFIFTDDISSSDTPKNKFNRNMEAIRTLKEIEGESRTATPEEQKVLAQYVGWGGLSEAFDERKTAWADEYQELKGILSEEEYRTARASTTDAFYTNPEIAGCMYEALQNMGFTGGNILEPSMGIGNFFGSMPERMEKQSKLYGVEQDSLSGRIATLLYPKADITINGFEKTDYPDNFFDVAIGNVPFGQYKVADKQYDKHNFLIHDYFFAKALDKVRPGGVIAFITSKGTMDKQNSSVRKYIAQRAELLGAVRLPNTAFKDNAGTEVTSDILFLKKRDRILDIEPEWVHLKENEAGILINQYFAEHPEMIVGKMEMVSGPYGMESTCQPDTTRALKEQLKEAISHINGKIDAVELDELENEESIMAIPADPNVRNFSYTIVGDEIFYRENSIMKPVEVSDTVKQHIKGMVELRDCTRELIDLQLNEYPDDVIKEKQAELNILYDNFSEKYGLINSQTNKRAFSQDSSYCLLCSLERTDEEGKFIGKADMFTKRTIKKAEVVTSVDTASEALAVSLSEKAKIDLDYMAELTGKDIDTIKKELSGIIFQNPVTDMWETADEYLSGNVREKLAMAKVFAEKHPEYAINVTSLEGVQPKELDASEIEVRIGATWIPSEYIEQFMQETFETPQHLLDRNVMSVQYSDVTGQWNVKGKNADYGNALVNVTYGTSRRNAYMILEDSLNLKDSCVYDTIEEDGKEKRVINKKETTIASQKQEAIREAFKEWIFRSQERRQVLVEKYNQLFNSSRPREYDGSHLKFPGMTPDIELKPHQKNAVAHVLYGNNTLLAHCVGAGKTFEMTAAAMESKRLGLCQKSLFVVPNHLTEQWASDFLRLYPGANILAATKKDFEPANRKKFCSRIATGDWDAVIIGHSQFEKIPLSQERQAAVIEHQIDEIEAAIDQAKADNGEHYTIKQMEKSRKALQTRLDKLNDTTRKDNVVTFEQLGVDRLFVDESHNYKNLFLYTKMRNVAGIAQTEAQKSSDMYAKCQYMDELTGGKGVTFATGTPISNSMTELYTNMRYLQNGTLQRLGLGHFDSWAATFGETQTAIELAPEGTGYRAKIRFARFFNLPELISIFKESADIQTPDMLKLPVPEADYENVVLKPSEFQQEMVKELGNRAENVRNNLVDSSIDNMLKITNDGRKLALDQRLINPMLPDDENSKASVCVNKAFEIWEQTKEQKSTQLIFCDLSTPKGDGTFNLYEDIKNKLIEKGVPPEEIAFIHDANTETRKEELFAKVRSGQVRFLLGSTQKMGAGTNVQDKLIALHHLDIPWRPSDIEQQEGRILRQGNTNSRVKIFRYVTEGTFDSYSWQTIENKQKFIGQIMTSKSPVRSCEDIDEAALSYAEVKALATGNPYIKEKMDLDIQVSKLKLLKANHTSQRYRLEDDISKNYPRQISALSELIEGYTTDIQRYTSLLPADKDSFKMQVGNKIYTDKKEAGMAIVSLCKEIRTINSDAVIGEYLGFKMQISYDVMFNKIQLGLKGQLKHTVELGSDPLGNITRINNLLSSMGNKLEENKYKLSNVEHQLENARIEVLKPFEKEAELKEKTNRLSKLNALLNMDETGGEIDVITDEREDEDKDETTVTLVVSECREFHNYGVCYEGIKTVDDAIKQFHDIPPERLCAVPSIGINIHKEGAAASDDIQVDIATANRINLDFLQYFPNIINNKKAVEIIREIIDKMPNAEIIGDISLVKREDTILDKIAKAKATEETFRNKSVILKKSEKEM